MKKIDRKKEMEKAKGFINEFKTFIKRGNVVDLAVGFIMGSAFGKIVTSMVEDILMPLIGIIIGGIDFQNLTFKIGNAVVKYGSFLQNIINFLIVSFCIFIFVKIINEFKEEEKVEKKTHHFKCKICGYVHEADHLDDNFRCPLCGKGKEFFEQID